MKKNLTLFLGLILSAAPLGADQAAPESPCLWPDKPARFASSDQLEAFKRGANEYKQCVNDFIKAQEEAIRAHRWAADEARKDWETFSRRELD